MENETKRGLLEALIAIRDDNAQNDEQKWAFRQLGICGAVGVYCEANDQLLYNIADIEKELKALCKEWPEASGDEYYPVPSGDDNVSASDEYLYGKIPSIG